jgi:hypothetical protein
MIYFATLKRMKAETLWGMEYTGRGQTEVEAWISLQISSYA